MKILSIFFISFFLLVDTAMAAKVIGRIMVKKGKVLVKVGGKGKPKKARVGMKIKAKDSIIAKKNSRAKIVMLDKNTIHISPESEMVFENYEFQPKKNKKNVLLNVLYGKVRSNVKQKYDGDKNRYQVKTKAAVAGVRGTDFLSSYNPSSGQSQFVTFEGIVEVGQPGAGNQIVNSVQVAPGQTTTAAVGAPPAPPVSMPKTELAALEQESNGDLGSGPEERAPATDGQEQESGEEEANSEEPKNEPGADEQGGEAKNEEGGPEKGPNAEENASNENGPDAADGPDSTDGPDRSEGDGEKSAKGPNGPGPEGGPENDAGSGDQVGYEAGPDGNGPNANAEGPSSTGPGGDLAGGPDGDRRPADIGDGGFEGDGGMIQYDDMPATGGTDVAVPDSDYLPDLPPPVFVPPTDILDDCAFCTETIENGNSRLIINIINQ